MNKLRGKMVEHGVTSEMLAKDLNLNRSTLYRRFKNPEHFTVGEVKTMIDLLHLTIEEVEYIFR